MKKITVGFCLAAMYVLFLVSAVSAQESAQVKQGLSLYYERNFSGAAEIFSAALQENPGDSFSLIYMVDCYTREGKLRDLLNSLEDRALESPKNPYIKCHLGFAYFSQCLSQRDDLFEEPTNQFQEALKLDGDLAMGYLGIGTVYYQKRMMSRARSYFSKAAKLNNRDVMVLERLGDIYLVDDKNYSAAKNLFDEIIALYPSYPDGYFYSGAASQAMGDFNDALKMFRTSMELDPLGLTQGYYAPVRMGDIYFNNLKDYASALKSYEDALKINPENSYAKTMAEKAKNPDGEEKKEDK